MEAPTRRCNRELGEELAAEDSCTSEPHVRLTSRIMKAVNINPVAAWHIVNGSAGAQH